MLSFTGRSVCSLHLVLVRMYYAVLRICSEANLVPFIYVLLYSVHSCVDHHSHLFATLPYQQQSPKTLKVINLSEP